MSRNSGRHAQAVHQCQGRKPNMRATVMMRRRRLRALCISSTYACRGVSGRGGSAGSCCRCLPGRAAQAHACGAGQVEGGPTAASTSFSFCCCCCCEAEMQGSGRGQGWV